MIDYNAFNDNDSALTEIKHVRDYLVSNKLANEETDILFVEPPFADLQTHVNEMEEDAKEEDEKMVKEEEKDEDFEIKCTICPKVNSVQGHKIFDIIHKEQHDGQRCKRLTPATDQERMKMSLIEGLLDEAVAILGSDWKLVVDYMNIHPFNSDLKKSQIEIYKERLEKRNIHIVGSPLFFYIDPMKQSRIPLLLDVKVPLYHHLKMDNRLDRINQSLI